ncbi:hypothetical protein P378_18075 [Desulforamulus profundi]|uniref:Uncharacterized protein n=1 Tax=Desulforamulus profundi TaxID=1383067 RepID=A0A2C6MAW2_9FIRM|nr:hypothetical protein P378_18075 [Desulforamulus profundi]
MFSGKKIPCYFSVIKKVAGSGKYNKDIFGQQISANLACMGGSKRNLYFNICLNMLFLKY